MVISIFCFVDAAVGTYPPPGGYPPAGTQFICKYEHLQHFSNLLGKAVIHLLAVILLLAGIPVLLAHTVLPGKACFFFFLY
jgi:hypothetical protein